MIIKRLIWLIFLFVALMFAVGIYLHLSGKSSYLAVRPPQGIVYYYGKECPHCKITDAFLVDNKVASKVSFVSKEVYHHKANLHELTGLARLCSPKLRVVELPFLWTGHACIMGSEAIIKFFKDKMKEKKPHG
jgi:hypothetical protein